MPGSLTHFSGQRLHEYCSLRIENPEEAPRCRMGLSNGTFPLVKWNVRKPHVVVWACQVELSLQSFTEVRAERGI